MKMRIKEGKKVMEIYGIDEERAEVLLEKVANICDMEVEYWEKVREIYKFAKNCREVGYMLNYLLIFEFGKNFDELLENGMNVKENNDMGYMFG